MREAGFNKYLEGHVTTGAELNDSLPDVFTVLEDVKAERSVAQQDLWGELHFQKLPKWVAPLINPETEHLCRPVELKTGITKTITHSWGRYEGD